MDLQFFSRLIVTAVFCIVLEKNLVGLLTRFMPALFAFLLESDLEYVDITHEKGQI